jgi:phage-related protein
MGWTIETYHTGAGNAPMESFVASLSKEDRAALLALLTKLEQRGNTLRLPHSKALGKGLFELRTKSGVRVFYVFRDHRRIVLLDGIVKKRDDIPADVLTRMRGLADSVS